MFPPLSTCKRSLIISFFWGMGQLTKGTILSDIWGRSRWQGQADVKYLVDKFANLGKFHPAWPRDKSWGGRKRQRIVWAGNWNAVSLAKRMQTMGCGKRKIRTFQPVMWCTTYIPHNTIMPYNDKLHKSNNEIFLYYTMFYFQTIPCNSALLRDYIFQCSASIPLCSYRISGHPRIVS